MKTFVIGDIHGRYKALKEVLKSSKFDYNKDKLIILGDIVDGGINTYKVVEELLKIKFTIFVLGNHDCWVMKYISSGWADSIWISQGGANTLRSYGADVLEARTITDDPVIITSNLNIPATHQDFFNRAKYYHLENEMLFVHGGIDPKKPIELQTKYTLVWDRDLIDDAQEKPIPGYNKIFIGHTSTQKFNGVMFPIKYNNLIMMDCGGGWNGKLAIMDIESEEYWLSKKQEGGK